MAPSSSSFRRAWTCSDRWAGSATMYLMISDRESTSSGCAWTLASAKRTKGKSGLRLNCFHVSTLQISTDFATCGIADRESHLGRPRVLPLETCGPCLSTVRPPEPVPEPRNSSCQGEVDGVDHSALSRAIWTPDHERAAPDFSERSQSPGIHECESPRSDHAGICLLVRSKRSVRRSGSGSGSPERAS